MRGGLPFTVVVLVTLIGCSAEPTPPPSLRSVTAAPVTAAPAEESSRPTAVASPGPMAVASVVTSPSPAGVASPSPAQVGSLLPLPNPGGTCSASQFVVGQATSEYVSSTVVTNHVGVWQPLRDAGADCVLALPKVIGLAAASGLFEAVEVANLGQEICKKAAPGTGLDRECRFVYPTSFQVQSGQTVTIELNASWWLGDSASQTPPPCAGTISNVTRAEFPLASDAIDFDWDTTVEEVCTSPTSMSVTVTN